MADPLSIASGIAGLLSFGIQVTQSLVNFYTTYKDQDVDLAKVTQNLDNLQSIFRALDVAVEGRRSQADSQDLLREVEKAVQKCEEIISELQSECERFHKDAAAAAGLKDRVKAAGRRAAYPFRKSTLQKLEEDINDIRENLSFALDVLQLKSQSQIQDGISEVISLVERINASQISLTIRCWLMAPDASLNHNATLAKWHPSTGLWFINGHRFRMWLEECNSFIWLNGFAGCGKSVLCSTTILHTFRQMSHKYGVGIAFFYFSFTEEAKQDDKGMLRTLLLQLSVQQQNGERELEQLHALYESGSPPVHALLESLRRLLDRFRYTYILLDALDESPRDCKREGVLEAIQVIRSWSIPSVHLLVTSRSELDIRESLDPSPDQDLTLRNSETDRDIANFVSYRLKDDAKLQRWKSRHEDIEKKLTTGAQGVFRYVECQFNALRRVKNVDQLDKCLRTLPRDLDETYERILCSIHDDYVEDVRRVLAVLCISTRPLTVNELIDAHAVDLSDPPHLRRDGRSYDQDDLIDICLGLIEIVATEDDNEQKALTARIAHFSVQEYLQSDRILQQKANCFAIRSAPANTEIARVCLVYLMEPSLSGDLLDESKLKEFPLALFAAMNWYHHYANSIKEMPETEQLVARLFQDKTKSFATWIRLHDIDRRGAPHGLHRPIATMAAPLYYAALLGLASVLNGILPVETKELKLSEIVNAQGGRLGNALQAASWGGHEKVVQMLLDQGADINAQGGEYGNALQAASSGGHEKVVQMLLDQGADINAQGGFYGYALQAASWGGHEKVVQMLLDQGADINAQGGFYGYALQAASSGGHEKVVQMLLDQGADVNAQGGDYGYALQAASSGGHEKVVQMLLDQGADINAQGGFYGYALQAASWGGHEKVVQMLLDQGADINAQGGRFGNALQAALYRDHEKIVPMLLDQGADVNAQGGDYGYALQAASLRGHEKAVQMLLDRGADVNAQGGFYNNALQAASYGSHRKVVQMLLDQGADTNAQGGRFGNALQAALYKGHEKVVQMLLDQGADVNAQGGDYGYALQAASLRGHEKAVQMLLDRGADINAQGGFYDNALQAASYGSHRKVVQMLLDQGADINAQGGEYGNALQAASYGGHEKVVQMLMDRGAGPDVRDSTYGHTPLSLAAMEGHDNIVKLLLGAKKIVANVKDNCGRTPLYFAAWRGRDTVAKTILVFGSVDPDQGDHYGSTPLSIAVRNGHMEVVKMLLATGIVSCDSHDCFGRSVFWWAKRNGNTNIAKMLTDYSKKRGIPLCDEYVDVRATHTIDVEFATEGILIFVRNAMSLEGVVCKAAIA
ncbi:NACHT nucleoside triphosphatase [Penicillium longicatenatum]|uniref:NACHT nucleoside triphosphatase n=1 Tax=Penicillium longicatenatum TaxID=1561947 RepID=UPI0025497C3C|nr:NACHT nucleoside triphosphatase [Penicillium longicatenatum]KAJ5651137.1 NACHT nucleoside triphosphatase [Penicillium longicatenatum]